MGLPLPPLFPLPQRQAFPLPSSWPPRTSPGPQGADLLLCSGREHALPSPHPGGPLTVMGQGRGGGELMVFRLRRAQGTRVLVHCKMGVSRSAATVVAYAMKQYGWGLEQALRHVQELRPVARPNPGFLRQLQTYQGILTARCGEGGGAGGGTLGVAAGPLSADSRPPPTSSQPAEPCLGAESR